MSTQPKRRARHLAIAEKLREDLAHLEPGQSLPSRNQLRRRFHAGDETICSAISKLQEEGLLEEQGHKVVVAAARPDRYLAILTELDIFRPGTSYFFLRMIQSLREFFNSSGVPYRLYVGRNNLQDTSVVKRITCEEFLRDARAGRLLAAVTISTELDILRKALTGVDLPLITTEQHGSIGWVDYEDMVCQAIDCLVDHGRRRIAVIGHKNSTDGARPIPGFDAYDACVKHYSLEDHPDWRQAASGSSNPGAEAFRRVWNASDTKPDGLVVLDDIRYYELAPLLLYNRIAVPEDLMVVSHANKGNPRPMVPEPLRMELDPDAFARAVGISAITKLDLVSHTSENIPPIMRLIEDAAGTRGLEL